MRRVAAISDSSPLILFGKINRLSFLSSLFAEVLIPPAVHDEISQGEGSHIDAAAIARTPWIDVHRVADTPVLQALRRDLDPGEAEVVALALELRGLLPVLLDDRRGRRAARARGLTVIGSAGILISGKEKGLLPAVRPLLDELRAAGLYLGGVEYQKALMLSGE